MSTKLTVWNISATVQSTPSYISVYGQTILPGKSRLLDPAWVKRYPAPLDLLKRQGLVHVGPALPPNYQKSVEEQMKKVKNILSRPLTLAGKKFNPTLIKPEEVMDLTDEAYEDVKCDGLKVIEDFKEVQKIPINKPIKEKIGTGMINIESIKKLEIAKEPVETPEEEPPAEPEAKEEPEAIAPPEPVDEPSAPKKVAKKKVVSKKKATKKSS